MTMHLVRGMSSLNSKKRKVKRKPGWEKAQAEHDAWLMKMGCHPSQLKKKKKEFEEYVPATPYVRETKHIPSLKTSDTVCGIAPKPKANVYSGDYITGLATMHKSNIVPVGRGSDPKEFAQMRRN
jgi:hypothetical protein